MGKKLEGLKEGLKAKIHTDSLRVTLKKYKIGKYRAMMAHMDTGEWKSWKPEYESKPSKLYHCWGLPEHWEESWRLEETDCLSDSSERPLANTHEKTL